MLILGRSFGEILGLQDTLPLVFLIEYLYLAAMLIVATQFVSKSHRFLIINGGLLLLSAIMANYPTEAIPGSLGHVLPPALIVYGALRLLDLVFIAASSFMMLSAFRLVWAAAQARISPEKPGLLLLMNKTPTVVTRTKF